jgi:hypothetical protein
MNWRRCGRKWSLPNSGTRPASLEDLRKTAKNSVRIASLGLIYNRGSPGILSIRVAHLTATCDTQCVDFNKHD